MASNAETNIAKALELKAQGNEAFKAADYKQAMVHYHQVARHATVPKHARKQLTPASRQRDSRAHAPVAAPPTCRIATRAPCRPCATTHQHARRSGLLRRLEPTPVGCAPTRVRAWCVQIYMYVHGFSEGSGAGGGQSMPGQTTKPVITHPSPVVRPSFTRRSLVVHSSFTRPSGGPGDDGADQGAQGGPLLQPVHVSHEAWQRAEGARQLEQGPGHR